ncbi:enhancer of mRNA-decapping protein 4 isoform X3 [Cimex lectularius]|uniref:Enhancer of mRNA-decapping protein 4 n=1 Tax=Cimex lectularius TaxID=79782 RepID=A0A8I6S8U1_CIMLE|nr:enhancer of mRNA-decapping protein 4 isoform X3 [Cimex lectularius]
MLEVSFNHYILRICFLITVTIIKKYFKGRLQTMSMFGTMKRHKEKSFQLLDYTTYGEEASCVKLVSEDVRVISSQGDHTTGSSKVKMHNIVDYSWEEKFYAGQLLAVHMGGKYFAYGIKAVNKTQSVIRVINRETSKRALIKGIEGMIEDLAFAFIPNKVILACLDCSGAVQVHNIEQEGNEITCKLILHILVDDTLETYLPRRVFWCPYMTEDENAAARDPYEDEIRHLLAVTRDNKIEMWNVAVVSRNHGSGPLMSEQISEGFLEIEVSTHLISDAAFSPDGTAIATASYDGKCKFFQVYMYGEEEPRCLHEWEPHGGEAVTTLLFLDNLRNPHPDFQFWKFAMTGAKNNCELKLWSCETWECLQTITFSSSVPRGNKQLKAGIDLAAGYILLSDMFSRLLYIMELQKKTNETQPFVQTITEFKLPCAILSFGIVDAGPKVFKANTSFSLEDLCNGEGDEESQMAVLVRMFVVQPKSLQECHIVFQTSNAILVPPQMNKFVSRKIPSLPELTENTNSGNSTSSQQPVQLNLMKPEAFHSPARESPTTIRESGNSSDRESQNLKTYAANTVLISSNEVTTAGGFVSAGSSPSREVQEILSSPRFFNQSTQQPSEHTPNNLSCPVSLPNDKLRGLESAIHTLSSDISSLTHLISKQNSEIEALKENIRRKDMDNSSDLEETMVRALLNSKVKCAMSNKVLAEEISSNLQPSVLSLISKEMQQQIRPVVKKTLEELKVIIQNEISTKLTASDQILKDNLGKLIRSKPFMETLNSQLSISAGNAMEHIYKDTFTKLAVPVFEKACANLFKQINDTFSKGLTEYIKEIEAHACKSNERMNMEIIAMQSATEHMTVATQKFSTLVEKETKRLEDAILEVGRNIKGSTLNNGNMRSGTATPAQHFLDSQQLITQLSQLIKQGDYNTAFQQALSASDLSLVMYVCEKVGPHQVFTQNGCLLQQHILLSLIQQLSADMSHHSETKYKYLEEAIMNLDNCNANTREHMPNVLGVLLKQLQVYIATNPKGKFNRRAKMLTMATQSLL